jgi:hypothetical protein
MAILRNPMQNPDRDPRSAGSFGSNQGPTAPPPAPPLQEPPVSLGSSAGPGPEGGARGGESPRERGATMGAPPMGGNTGGQPTSMPPMAPSPVAGQGLVPSAPLPGPNPQALTSTLRGSGGMFGSQGGLQGGGFGLPFDPTSNQESDPISSLLKLLQKG